MTQYTRLAILPINTVMEPMKKGEELLIAHGVTLSLRSSRLLTYLKGISCVHCGIDGSYFAIEKCKYTLSSKYHLNLYHKSKKDKEVLMTSDHILPKASGGKNTLSNRQPMCTFCNSAKGSHSSVEEGKSIRKEIAKNNKITKLLSIDSSIDYCNLVISEGNKDKDWNIILKHLEDRKNRLVGNVV